MLDSETDIDFTAALGHWVRFELEQLQKGIWIGFVYVDSEAGLSLKGGPEGTNAVELPTHTIRLPLPMKWSMIEPSEARALKLPKVPSWLHYYGPQPAADAPWRKDSFLKSRLHPRFPDDIQVIVHDGEPRRTGVGGEGCWVRISAFEGYLSRPLLYNPQATSLTPDEFDARYGEPVGIYSGILLSKPAQLTTVRQGDLLYFISSRELGLPLHVTPQYVEERAAWEIQPCNKCGFDEGFDPPSIMYRTRFPDTPPDAIPGMFTAFCINCGGMQMFMARGSS